MRVAALVLAAGRGERLRRSLATSGALEVPAPPPKAFLALGGRSLLARSLAALTAVPEIEALLPVVPAGMERAWAPAAGVDHDNAKLLPAVAGGAERPDSVAAGLAALPATVTHVAVHDAARPLVTATDAGRVVREGLAHGAAFLAAPVTDTVHRVSDGRLAETPPRETLWAAQTPQVFAIEILREALEKARADGHLGTDDAGLVARLGVAVRMVEGDPANRKITTALDLAWAEAHLLQQVER